MSDKKNLGHNSKKDFLNSPVEHVDITSFDSRKIIASMEKMSFVSRETANAAHIFNDMIKDKECTIFLTLAGSTSAAGCMDIYRDMIKYNMVDAIVATGASIIDMDFFEALGFKHYQGSQFQDDTELRKNYIDRIYDTYIDEDELQMCDKTICEIANTLPPKSYTSREFIKENDYVELGQLGAYGLTFRTDFNGLYSNNIFEVDDNPIMTMYNKEANKEFLVA